MSEVIRAVLNSFLRKDFAQKAPKAQRRNQAKARKHKTQISD